MPILDAVLRYAQDHRTEQLDRLCDWLRIPSISTLPGHAADVKHAAQWATGYLDWLGMDRVELVETQGHPIVYSEWRGLPEGGPTLLLYGHYDVQPVDPLGDWLSPPFEPQIVGKDLVGRGTADDKGQFFAIMAALEAYLKTSQKLPVNIKVLLEGEEEVLSPNLSPFLRDNRQMLSADAILIADQ
jgi:acetylornithine deacetylase/succinyl-diaminopimelate desuccinylase-like protein